MSYLSKLKALWGMGYRSGSRNKFVFRPREIYNLAKFMIHRPFNPVKLSYYPVTLMIEVSTVCNLKCPTCERELFKENGGLPNGHVSIKNIERLRLILPYVHSIFFVSGMGEPFLNPAFWDFNRIAKEYKITTGYFSNATIWTDEIIERTFREGINSVLVSMDSHVPERYESFKKGAKFEVSVENIEKLNKIRERFPDANFKLGINYIPRSDNYKDMSDYLDFAKKLKVDFVFFTALISHRPADIEKSPYLVDVKKRKEVYEKVRAKAKQYNIAVRLPEVEVKNLYKHTCNSAWRCLSVFQNGDVCLCPYFRTKREFYFHVEDGRVVQEKRFVGDTVVGNICRQNILDILNSEKAMKIRRSLKKGSGIPSPCDTCYYRYDLH